MTIASYSTPTACPDCGLSLPENAPLGLCPACLLQSLMETHGDAADRPESASASHRAAMETLSERSDLLSEQDRMSELVVGLDKLSTGDSRLAPGSPRVFGDYELHEEVARGGMGVVYRARHRRLNRQVALKMIRAGKFSSETEVQRLRVEAEAAAQLDHPGIVPVFEVGESEGLHYFTMAFVDGETLSAKISDHPLPVRTAAKLMQTVAEAVAYAHDRGIIHRDIKPGNILIDRSGQPRVTDFGLAKQVRCDSELTTTGQILGTPSWMPPEQALGNLSDVGPAADIYSLGAVLYATLTGRPPFQAQTTVETLQLVVEGFPLAPRLLNPSIPRDLETICLKCLEKSIPRRYTSAREVADEVRRFLTGEPILAQPAGALRKFARWYRRYWAVATAGVSILLTISVVATVLAVTASRLRTELTKTEKAEFAERSANQRAQEQLWVSFLNEASARHRSRQSGQRFGALRTIAKALKTPVPPDRSRDELRTAASAALCLPDLEFDRAWQHTSRMRQFAVDSRMTLFGVDDGATRVFLVKDVKEDRILMRLPLAEWYFDHQGPIFSPDSKLFVYPKMRNNENRLHLWRVGSDQPMADLGKDAMMVAFRPDSLRCAVGHSNGLVRILDCQSFEELARYEMGLTGSAVGVAWNPRLPQLALLDRNQWKIMDVESGTIVSHHEVEPGLEGWPAWDPSGKRLSAGAGDRKIGIWDATSKKLTVDPIQGHLNGGIIVRFSPDGNRVISNDWNNILRLWDTRTGKQLLSVPATGVKLQFSADGEYLAGDCTPTEFRIFRYRGGEEFRSVWEIPGVASQFERWHSVPCINRTGRILAIRSAAGVCLIDLQHDEVVCRLPIPDNGPLRFDNTSDGECLWTYGHRGLLSWPIQINEESGEALIGPPERLLNSGTQEGWGSSSSGDAILVPSLEGGILWNRKSRQQTLLPHSEDVRMCAVSPDGRLGFTGTHGFQEIGVRVWNLESGQKIADLPVPGFTGVFLSPDGKWLITNGNGTRIWKVGEWNDSRTLQPFRTYPCFSADGQLLALSDDLSVIRLLEPATGREVAVLMAPERTRLIPIAFTPDGSRLISIGEETAALHLFDLRAIRRQLAELGLDWDFPPLPAATGPIRSEAALKFTIDPGTLIRLEPSEAAGQTSEGSVQP